MTDPARTVTPATMTPATVTPATGPAAVPPGGGRLAGLRGELSNPLFRNAYALMANGGLTGVLGLGYWLIAARLYPPDVVGRNSAVLQAILFVSGLTAINYMLIRFIPQSGRRTGRLVVGSYAVGAISAALIGVGFLLTLSVWGPSFSRLGQMGPALWFIVGVLAWNIFAQQDGVFTGLRRAGWVPVENAVFGFIKVALLIPFATLAPADGIVLSTVVPAVIALLPVNWLIFRRLIPAHAAATDGRQRPPTFGQISRYMGGDYVGSLFSHASINLIPVVVAVHVAPSVNAYFMMAWVLGAMLDLLATNMAMSLTVEGAFDSERLAETTRAALRRIVMLVVPAAVVFIVAAPIGLRVFGDSYVHGSNLLRLLAAAALPKAIIEIYMGVLRVQSRTRPVAVLQAVRCLGVLAVVSVFTTSGSYVTIVGVAVLVVHVAVAAAVYPKLRAIARPAAAPAPAPHDPPASFASGPKRDIR
jgi:O-antigen/teichoic acid export membrane protein